MRTFGVVFCLLAMTACSEKSPAAPSPVSEQLTLAPGQTKSIDGAEIALKFEGVTGDSRCPIDGVCITGGDALVKLEVTPARGSRQRYDLHTGSLEPVRHEDLTISLVDLVPYPYSARPIDPAEYRLTVRVQR